MPNENEVSYFTLNSTTSSVFSSLRNLYTFLSTYIRDLYLYTDNLSLS